MTPSDAQTKLNNIGIGNFAKICGRFGGVNLTCVTGSITSFDTSSVTLSNGTAKPLKVGFAPTESIDAYTPITPPKIDFPNPQDLPEDPDWIK